ncbi:dihydrodipicolinate synthase family protein [Dactylosporangium sp. NPDC000555]|uniref:dihydrodipicolinate synthase family protein n=1 Tax=Dactylosporangium sp. NPDC000555 TaxID=3154260 RepID=UPI003332B69A
MSARALPAKATRIGTSGIWLAPHATYTDSGVFDREGWVRLMDHCAELRVGTISHSLLADPWAQSLQQRKELVELMTETVGGRVPVAVYATAHSVGTTIDLVGHAGAIGADFALLNCPFEWAATEASALRWFHTVLDRTGMDISIVIYNSAHSGILLRAGAVSELADQPQVVAVLNGAGTFESSVELHRAVGDRILVSDPFERHQLRAWEAYGQPILMTSTASLLMQTARWTPIRDYIALAHAGEMEAAQELFDRIEPLRALWESVYAHSALDVEHAAHPLAQTRYWQQAMGLPAGPPTRPLAEPSTAQKRRILTGLAPYVERWGVEEPWNRQVRIIGGI